VLANLQAEKERRIVENKLGHYWPYAKQATFHAAGAKHRERLLMAGNQLGKTLAGAMETAIHATGRYPEWWQGKRFDKPTVSWVAAPLARPFEIPCSAC
jgi:terminase large subunit-like protein